jgi:lambda family phage portal protein
MWPFRKTAVETVAESKPRARRAARAYSAAVISRRNSDFHDSRFSASREIRDALEIVRSRSRDAERNSGLYRRALDMLTTACVGDRGFTLQSLTTRPGSTVADELARTLIEAHWRAFAAERVTVCGRHDFVGLVELAVRSMLRDGEVFVRHVVRDGRLLFQVLEADFVPVRFDDEARRIVSGIEHDEFGRPTFYHIARQHPGATGWGTVGMPDCVRVPADEVVHLFRAERPGQVRGVPIGASIFDDLRMLNGYMSAELEAARMGASRPVTLERSLEATEEYDGDQDGDDDFPEIDMSAAGVTKLPAGWKANWNSATHPGGNFGPFVQAITKALAAALGVSHALLTRDLSQVNYSSLRIELVDVNRTVAALQRHVVETLVRPCFESWLRFELMSGRLAQGRVVLRESDFERHRAARWIAQPPVSIDKTDLAEARERVELGISTLSTECRRLTGRELDDVVRERAAEIETLRRAGLLPAVAAPEPG